MATFCSRCNLSFWEESQKNICCLLTFEMCGWIEQWMENFSCDCWEVDDYCFYYHYSYRILVWLFCRYIAWLKTVLQLLATVSIFDVAIVVSGSSQVTILCHSILIKYVSHFVMCFSRFKQRVLRMNWRRGSLYICKPLTHWFTYDLMGSSSCCGNKLERRSIRGGRESLGSFQTLGKLKCCSVIRVRKRGPRCGASMCCHNADALKHKSKTCSRYCGSAHSGITSIAHSNESPGNKLSHHSWPTLHNSVILECR